MKKNLLLAILCLCFVFATATACVEDVEDSSCAHNYVMHEEVVADCENRGNAAYYTCANCELIFNADKTEIEAIPYVDALGHNLQKQDGVVSTCNTKGQVEHYKCANCNKLFDLEEKEITKVELELDETNHTAQVELSVVSEPTKLAYYVGETFDATGMQLKVKCADCEGELVDNAQLTYVYETEGNQAFVVGDTTITVKYGELSANFTVTVTKQAITISGVEESYSVVCGNTPEINATSSVADSDIVIKYYDGETEVNVESLAAGKTYTAKITIAETDNYLSAEKTATVTVSHEYAWGHAKGENVDWHKYEYKCVCGDKKDFYAMDYQKPFVDADNLAVDLSAFVFNAEQVSVKSVQKVVRITETVYEFDASKCEKVALSAENDGMVYTFAESEYEQITPGVKPYQLTIYIVYEIDGVECPIYAEIQLVTKIIKTANELTALTYTGPADDPNGEYAMGENGMYGVYYVLANDIDASGLSLSASNPCWHNNGGFRGTLDGNGHTISNLNTSSHGLFGSIGLNAVIKNIKFTNLKADSEYTFAYAIRSARFEDVTIEYSKDSAKYQLANETPDTMFTKVSILTDKNSGVTYPEGIELTYFAQHNVTFDPANGSETTIVAVTDGKKVAAPENPTKTDDNNKYVFIGWYNGDTAWNFENDVVTEEITLIARYDVIVVTKISSANDLLKLCYTGSNDDTTGEHAIYGLFELTQDIDATGLSLLVTEPCWHATGGFRGTLDGNGHTISNLTTSAHGLFGATGIGAVIKNINFTNVNSTSPYTFAYALRNTEFNNVTIEYSLISNNSFVAGEANNCTFTSVNVKVKEGNEKLLSNSNARLEGVTISYISTTIEKQEVALKIGQMTDSDETNEYGKIYNVIQDQWFIDNPNPNTLTAIPTSRMKELLPEGFDHLEFYIYNPNETAYKFHTAGDVSAENGGWKDGTDDVSLAANAWTKVVISNATIQLNTEGQWYFYILGGGAAQNGWKVTTVYAVK